MRLSLQMFAKSYTDELILRCIENLLWLYIYYMRRREHNYFHSSPPNRA